MTSVPLPSPSRSSPGGGAGKRASLITVGGGGGQEMVQHSYSAEEVLSVAEHINMTLMGEGGLETRLPIGGESESFFDALKDGVVICKLINVVIPETIDDRAIATKKSLNKWELQENVNLCVQSAKAIGIKMVNIGAEDIIEGKPHLVLSVLWQLIKIQLLQNVTLQSVPELALLLEDGEELSALPKLSPETKLLRWMNYHLKRAGSAKRVTNFSSDVKDAEAYLLLLNQLAPEECPTTALGKSDPLDRAIAVLDNAAKLEANKYVTPKDIVAGVQRLNLAFVANLFNVRHGLVPEKEIDLAELDLDEDLNETREERVFKNWINSGGASSHCHHLVYDLQDGVILLETMAKLNPDSFNPKRVNRPPYKLPFKKIENCSYVIELAKECNLPLIGIGGEDIYNGNKKLLLGLIWQLLRYDTFRMLKDLGGGGNKGGAKDADILKWANETVAGGGSVRKITSFKDKSIADGLFFMDLLIALEERTVNKDLVTKGESETDKEMNAKYVISVARKLGCSVFILWEHIVEVDPKMMLLLTASIMQKRRK